ncbi:MAG: NAD-dependent epimerase/dehydratase family protein [Chloroflexota bacterium]
MNTPTRPRAFVTGGAGFIGSHVVNRLLAEGYQVTVYDNLSRGSLKGIEPALETGDCRFVKGDLLDPTGLIAAMREHQVVWHLAANTDIRAGTRAVDLDLVHCVVGTCQVLEAMRQNGIRDLLFASSGVVYGDVAAAAMPETAGPLLPVSLYAAGKLGGEAFVSAYCHLFGLRAWIFRFANVIGRGTDHGVVYDFIQKLRQNPSELEVLGDGNQVKPYLLVDECVDGMLYAFRRIPLTAERPSDVFNLGTDTVTRVRDIARIAIEEMGLDGARIRFTGGRRGWPGDAPVLRMDVEKLRRLGWTASHSSDEAVRIAARQLIAECDASASSSTPG